MKYLKHLIFLGARAFLLFIARRPRLFARLDEPAKDGVADLFFDDLPMVYAPPPVVAPAPPKKLVPPPRLYISQATLDARRQQRARIPLPS